MKTYNFKNLSTFGKFLEFYLDCINKFPLPYLFQPDLQANEEHHTMNLISDRQNKGLLKNK